MHELRLCPSCGELQEWCDTRFCDGPIPRGHWSHVGDGDCAAIGDRNPDPAGPPDFSWDEWGIAHA
jgi:hypothetical protein